MKALLNVLETRLLRRPGWLRPSPAPAIAVSEACFVVRGLAVPWEAVSRIRARRGVHGDICLDIGADVEPGSISVSEDQRGFDDFAAMADRRMTFPLAWWDELDRAGARRHGLTLFERQNHG